MSSLTLATSLCYECIVKLFKLNAEAGPEPSPCPHLALGSVYKMSYVYSHAPFDIHIIFCEIIHCMTCDHGATQG